MSENNLLISNFDHKIEHGRCFVAGVRIVERYNYTPIEDGYDETVIVEGNRERLRAAVIRALNYAREHGLRVQCNNPHVRGDIESGIFDTAGLIIVDSIGRTIVDDQDRTGDCNMTNHPIEIVYKGVTYEKVLWNCYDGFNPEKCMYESSDDKAHIIVVTKDAILDFGDYFKEDGFTVNWENFDKAYAELRKF